MREIENGYGIESNVLSSDECDSLIWTIAKESRSRGRAGVRNLMRNQSVRELANDSRLLGIANRFLGLSAIPYRATLFEKSGRANWLVVWHQDTVLPLERRIESDEWGPWSKKAGVLYAHAPAWAFNRVIALRLHLDPSTKANGPLRVIPGSHVFGILSEPDVIRIAHDQINEECLCPKGGVLAMRPLLIHASSKVVDEKPRRVLHIEYTDSLELTDHIRIAVA